MTELPLMLSTDQGLVIASQQYVLDSVPDGQAHLSFSFGFETDEVLLPQNFSDSVSVGLVSEDQSAFLLLLSADAGGVTWAPTNPLGVLLDSETISRTPTDSRFGPPVYQSGEAYRVSLSLPEAFSKSGTEVYLDLVDNSNGLRSVGWLDSVSFEGIEDSMSLEVFSARSLLGPFLPEAHAIIDETNRLISVPLAGPQRFFRIESGGASKVTEIQRLGDNWSVDFILLDSEPRVWTGNSVSEVVQRVPLKSLGLGFWEASLKMDQS
ncbi:hypothetical protein N8737_03825, partial [Verrucomicrobia bacterium]|nr:hypothetical protein [Verrucomicrobiota bacterium]